MNHKPLLPSFLLLLALGLASPALATNGMNMEGYGPIALGLGGASFAYDNGTAAVINNPATLGLARQGLRMDLALGFLGPDVESSLDSERWQSRADAFYMPAMGLSRKKGRFSYGMAVFAQGGMGTDYTVGPGASLSAMLMQSGDTATGAGNPGAAAIAEAGALRERTEIGVGRLMVPVAFEVNDRLIIGGTVDFVWASMDLQMAMSGKQMFGLVGSGFINGSMIDALQGAMGSGAVNDVYYGYFDFANNNDFTGQASSTGFAGKIGLAYRVNQRLTLGATYHSKVNLDQFEGKARVSMAVSGDTGFLGGGTLSGTYADASIPLEGEIRIREFGWPSVFGLGLAYQATDRWFLAADVKRIGWAGVMESFKMTFTASDAPSNGAFAGLKLNADMQQDWNDQTVFQAGAAFSATSNLILRAGINYADNPVPDALVFYLFPATTKSHYTGGIGYATGDSSQVNFAMSYVPEVDVTNTQSGIRTKHSQLNWQIMYSHFF